MKFIRGVLRRALCCVLVLLLLLPFLLGVGTAAPEQAAKLQIVISQGHTPQSVMFSADGKLLATAGTDDTVRLWDVASGRQLRVFDRYANSPSNNRPSGRATRMALSPDGRYVVYCAHRSPQLPTQDTRSKPGLLLWDIHKGEAVSVGGLPREAMAVSFSPDSHWFAVGDASGTCSLFAVEKPKKPRRVFGDDVQVVVAVRFASDSKSVFVACDTGGVRRYSTKGKKLARFSFGAGAADADAQFWDLAVSGDGRRLCVGETRGVTIWDVEKPGRPLHVVQTGLPASAVGLNADGSRLLYASGGVVVRIQDSATDNNMISIQGGDWLFETAALAPDGRTVLTAGFGPQWEGGIKGQRTPLSGPLRVFDAASGKLLRDFRYATRSIGDCAMTADGAYLVTVERQGWVRVWSARTGQLVRKMAEGLTSYLSVAPEGHEVLFGSAFFAESKPAQVIDVATGRVVRTLGDHDRSVTSVLMLAGGHLATGDEAGVVRIFARATGELIHRIPAHQKGVVHLSASPKGDLLLSCGLDKRACLWSVETGRLRQELTSLADPQFGCFSPDGTRVFTRPEDTLVASFLVKSGRERQRYPLSNKDPGHTQAITCFVLSPDGKYLVTGSWDTDLHVWNVKTGRYVRALGGHVGDIRSVRFTPDGRHLLTTSGDRTIEILSFASGLRVGRLAYGSTYWVACDDAGHFDASNLGYTEQAHAVRGMEILGLDQIRDRHFEPGLLARILGGHPPVVTPPPQPAPTLLLLGRREATDPIVQVRVQNTGGGIGPVNVRLNGKRITKDARGQTASASEKYQDVKIDLANDPRVLPGTKNQVEVRAANADHSAQSRGLVTDYDAPGEPRPAHLWAIVCGVSEYAGTPLQLKFAHKDAQDFSTALRLAAEAQFGKERTHIVTLTSPAAPGTTAATRANLEAAFAAAQSGEPKVKSEDIFVVYLAGHGVVAGKGEYHYLLADAQSADLSDATVRESVAISSSQLAAWMEDIASVQRQVVLLDTCAAGEAREAFERLQTSVQMINELRERTGTFVLAGCAGDKVSYESNQYGQGLLTYSLLFGLQCGCHLPAAKEGGGRVRVDIRSLMNYALEKVPEAAMDAGLRPQQPVKLEGDESFDIGTLTPDARKQIPLQSAKPRLVRSRFELDKEPDDALHLSREVDAATRRFRVEDTKRSALVFVDAPSMPGAFRLGGRYTQENGSTTVSVFVYQDGVEGKVGAFEAKGPAGTPEQVRALADEIVRRAFEEVIHKRSK